MVRRSVDVNSIISDASLALILTFLHVLRAHAVDSLRFSEGEDVTLDTGVSELQRDDQILWSFGSEDTIIAKRGGDSNQVSNYADDGKFRDRLQMDDQTGSLTITNTKSIDSGVYHLQISSRNKVLYQKFTVCCEYSLSLYFHIMFLLIFSTQ